MVKAIRIHTHGGPEVLVAETADLAPPGPGEARVRHAAIGVNFSDVNVRRGGFYRARPLDFPVVLGNEGAGVIEALGEGVEGFVIGQRVAYAGAGGPFYENTGAYAEARNVPVRALVALPDDIPDQTAAAVMLKGLTASMIVNRVHPPRAGETILVHTAASGVGQLLAQWTAHLGGRVIGTAGSAEKAKIAAARGCAHVILYRETGLAQAVREIEPQGVAAVFDGVGRDTFSAALDCLAPFGMMVNYGNASGAPAPVDLIELAKRGSLAVSRPAFSEHVPTPDALRGAAAELFTLIRAGVLTVEIAATFPLAQAAEAHRGLESRAFAGSVLLIP